MRNIRQQREPMSSGYDTLFGATPLARAITQTQAAKISEGSQLEKMLTQSAAFGLDLSLPENLSSLLENTLCPQEKPYVIKKQDIKNHLWPALMEKRYPGFATLPKITQKELTQKVFQHEPDMLVVDATQNTMTFVELKSFCVFDTEKSQMIAQKLHSMPKSYDLPFKSKGQVVCFYAKTTKDILEGMKKRLKSHQVVTGIDFIEQISFKSMSDIEELTQGSHSDNVLFVLEKALETISDNEEDLKALINKFPLLKKLCQ